MALIPIHIDGLICAHKDAADGIIVHKASVRQDRRCPVQPQFWKAEVSSFKTGAGD